MNAIDMKKAFIEYIRAHDFASLKNVPNLASFIYDKAETESASFDERTGRAIITTEVQGTQYEGRTERIEKISESDKVEIVRDPDNKFNSNNLSVRNKNGESLGNLRSDLCDVMSPLIDGGVLSISKAIVNKVEPLSQRSKKAKKALLYVSIDAELKEISVDLKNGCIICFLGGDQINIWAQHLEMIACSIPIDEARCLFELYNRMNGEYDRLDEKDTNYSYLGLDNLKSEVLAANQKMRDGMKEGLDYSNQPECSSFKAFILANVKKYPERYSLVSKYAEELSDEMQSLADIFRNHAVDKKDFYWLDQTRVSYSEWNRENQTGFFHWYDIVELYQDGNIPFDLKDNDVVSIFGFNKFEAFADLSYGC